MVAVPSRCYLYRVYKAGARITWRMNDDGHGDMTNHRFAHEGRGVVRDDSSSSLSDIRANLLNSNPVTRPPRFMRCNGRGIRVDPKDHVLQRCTRRIYAIPRSRTFLYITLYHILPY